MRIQGPVGSHVAEFESTRELAVATLALGEAIFIGDADPKARPLLSRLVELEIRPKFSPVRIENEDLNMVYGALQTLAKSRRLSNPLNESVVSDILLARGMLEQFAD